MVLLAATSLGASACVGTQPSALPPHVHQALADQPMRRMETTYLEVYYPARRRDEARRIAQRLETCIRSLGSRKAIQNRLANRKYVVAMPEVAFNNAFVVPPFATQGPFALIPTVSALLTQPEMGMPLDGSTAGCHEMVHYVHETQIAGFWGFIDSVAGDLLTPQMGLEPWFAEGLATFYESRLQPGVGRMSWPAWRGFFHAAYAGGHGLDSGDLNAANRPFHGGSHYLVGSHFIEFLADRYGEDRLWQLVEGQGSSFWFPFGVSLRFRSAYGRGLGTLFDEFRDQVAERFPVRRRPPGQATFHDAGEDARYAIGPDGSEALVVQSADQPTRLVVYGPDGAERVSRALTDVLPGRQIVAAFPTSVSGLSFTGDGRHLFLVADDQGPTHLEARLIRFDVADGDLEILASDIGGIGGSVSAAGDRYYFSRSDGDRYDLCVLDLRQGVVDTIRRADPRGYYAEPRIDPTGRRLVASYFDGLRLSVQVIDARSGRLLASIAPPGVQVLGGAFRDEDRLLYLAEVERRFQVHEYSLAAGTSTRMTDVPYLALVPQARGDQVRFLNRDGMAWTVDGVALPTRVPAGGASIPAGEVAPLASPAETAAAAFAPPADRPLTVVTDEPYSAFDHLFVPNLRFFALVAPATDTLLSGLTLAGSDRLQFHRWGLTGLYQSATKDVSGVFQYFDRSLAPISIAASASRYAWGEGEDLDKGAEPELRRQEWQGFVAIQRTFWTTTIALGGTILDDREKEPATPWVVRRLAGPIALVEYAGLESTDYTGIRRGLVIGAWAFYFPDAATTFDDTFGDVRGWLQAFSPLPLSRRHTLSLSLVGRALPGLDEPLLQVGGLNPGIELFRDSDRPDGPEFDEDVLPEGFAFREPLRGFEDFSLAVDRVGIATLVYRHPLIIDRGISSILVLLPSFFLREIDLELFAAGAADRPDRDNLHASAGASLEVSTVLGSLVPLGLKYQLARRLTDDDALVHLFLLTSGL